MKLFISLILICAPIASIFHYQPKEKPQVNRLAQERRVQEIRDFCKPDTSVESPRLKMPEGYPSDPDSMTSGYEPGEDR